MANSLILVVPGLLAQPLQRTAGVPSLRALARYADPPRSEPRGIAAALLAALGIAPATPVAPLALLGAGGDPGDDYVLCADPVHLAADRDTVLLVQTIDDLSQADAATLVRMLDRHFSDDGVQFEAPRPAAWFARRREPANLVTTPPDAARGRNLIASLPRGADSGTWKRWQNEIEMLLYEHPVNAARERRGMPPANALWFWGGGRMADVADVPVSIVTAPQTRLGDLARGIARRGGRDSPSNADVARLLALADGANVDVGAPVCCVAVSAPLADDLESFEAASLAPAIELLTTRRIAALHVVADGNGTAATWTATPPTLWRRLVARASPRAFEVAPPADP
ncbi:MAG TPA: hypothetical protein VLN42_09040 [Casimicrobiaceae bacterium]|nr:hypothetical protein [Casimicrobiaceae bacterium]